MSNIFYSIIFSFLYTSPKLLEISTNGRVNVELSDDPLYNKVSAAANLQTSNSAISDLQTILGVGLHSDPALAGAGHLQHAGVPGHQGEQQEVDKHCFC